MLAAVLPAANAASVTELEERIEVLEARVASLERIILSSSHNPNRIYVCSVKPFQKLFEASKIRLTRLPLRNPIFPYHLF